MIYCCKYRCTNMFNKTFNFKGADNAALKTRVATTASLHSVILTLLCQEMLTQSDRAQWWNQHPVFSLRSEAMPSPVAEAMIESYALMVMVMGTFFLYFCGMVWAFCNPKLSNDQEASGTEKEIVQHLGNKHVCTQQTYRCASLQPHNAEGLTRSTYVNFRDNTDDLLSDCSPFCREGGGIVNLAGIDLDWTVGAYSINANVNE